MPEPLAPVSTTGAGPTRQRQAGVVAEVGELQPLDPDAVGEQAAPCPKRIGGTLHGCRDGLLLDARVMHQTRIGIST